MATASATVERIDFAYPTDIHPDVGATAPEVAEESQPTNHMQAVALRFTDPAHPRKSVNIFAVERPVTVTMVSRPAVATEQRTYVDGVIIAVDAESVACEMAVQSGPLRISLSRGLFQSNVQYGSPIRLKIVDDSGTRRVVVEDRPLANISQLREQSARLDSIIDQL